MQETVVAVVSRAHKHAMQNFFPELERLVEDRIIEFIHDASAIFEAVTLGVEDTAQRAAMIRAAEDLAARGPDLGSPERRALLQRLIRRIDLLRDAARIRFRPILLTSLTTFFGLAPMIFETSVQARFMIPMAISLGYGILFATLITLLLVPSLYLIIEDARSRCIKTRETRGADLASELKQLP